MVVRREAGQIEVDHQLKLRIANAIHTAMVYFMVRAGFTCVRLCICVCARARTTTFSSSSLHPNLPTSTPHKALSRMPDTSACIGHPLILPYIEALYQQDIRRMAEDVPVDMCVPTHPVHSNQYVRSCIHTHV